MGLGRGEWVGGREGWGGGVWTPLAELKNRKCPFHAFVINWSHAFHG